jgi:hypothetical protein
MSNFSTVFLSSDWNLTFTVEDCSSLLYYFKTIVQVRQVFLFVQTADSIVCQLAFIFNFA